MVKTKKILIISSNRLGDCILSSGLNKFFKEDAKDISLTVVCGQVPSNLFKYCKYIDNLIILKKKKFSLHWIFLWFKLFCTTWNFVIDLRGTGITFFLLSRKNFRLKRNQDFNHEHKVVQVTKAVTGQILSPSINILLSDSFERNNLNKLKILKKKYNLVMIAPTANWVGKIWPADRYLELIMELKKKPYFKKSIFIFTGPNTERKYVKEILDLRKPFIFDLFGKSSLIEIYHIMKHCSLFIGNDSGLMHMSSLANIKTIGLFGPSDKYTYGPWKKKNIAISSPKSPKDLMGHKGFDSKECGSLMFDLKTSIVIENILYYLKSGK